MAELMLTPEELRHWARVAEAERCTHVVVRTENLAPGELEPDPIAVLTIGLGPSTMVPAPGRNPFQG